MPGVPYIDYDLDQNRLTRSHSDYIADANHSLGRDIHRRAQVLSGQLLYPTNVSYPGSQGYATTKTETHTLRLPHHTNPPHHSLPDILIPGKRPNPEDAPRDIPQVSPNPDTETPLSDPRDSEHQPRTEVYELPASTDHPTHLTVRDAVSDPNRTFSPGVAFRDKAHRSSFVREFGYLGLCIASTAPAAAPAPQAEVVDGFAYLAGYINPGSTRQSTNMPSCSPGEEDLDDVSKLIDGGPALPTILSSSPQSEHPPPSPVPCPPSRSLSSPPIPPCSPSALPTARNTAPRLPPKPPAYRNLLTEHFTPLPLTTTHLLESYTAAQDLRTQNAETSSSSSPSPLPPKLPPKPAPYRRAGVLSPIEYEACVEARYYRGVSQRGRWRGERFRGCDLEEFDWG